MPYSSGGRPATALSATFEISWPSYTHAFVPSARVMNFGARSTYFAGRRPSNRCGGSTAWSSTLTRTMSSIFIADSSLPTSGSPDGAQLTPASAHGSTERTTARRDDRGVALLTNGSVTSAVGHLPEEPVMRYDERDGRPDGAVAIVRRAPFSDNPRVGARGQRTQQRILDAALRAFGERGLPRLQHRSDHEARPLLAGLLLPVLRQQGRRVPAAGRTGGTAGERVDRGARPAHARPSRVGPRCAHGSPATPRSTRVTSRCSTRWRPTTSSRPSRERTGEETIARIHARLATTTLPRRQLDPVIRLLLECLNHTLDVSGMLRSVVPDGYPGERVEIAFTDVLHRTLFGADMPT